MSIYPTNILAATAMAVVCGVTPAAAEETAETLFKAMSDFLTAQQALAVSYDATLEIVARDMQKVGLASSGALTVNRPDKVRLTRTGGIADVEMVYDGKTLSAYGKNLNAYTKHPIEGTLDDVIDALRFEFGLELPAADLLSSNPNETMMANVKGSSALGTGVIRGQVCDHLAFRTTDVDWQIWIAQGEKPFPCRFTITSKMTVLAPSYTIEFGSWKSGADVAADDFKLVTSADAKEVAIADIEGLDEVPAPDDEGAAQ